MPINETEPAGGEQPVFWLGMAGFAPDQRAVVEAALVRNTALPQWRVAPFRDADAWLVNGTKCRVHADGKLRIVPGMPNELTVNLDLANVDRPVAFAERPVSVDLQPSYDFDATSRASVQGVLLQFDSSMRWARAQFLLGRHVVELGTKLRHGIFHVSHQNRLLAVLDFRRGEAGLAPQLQPGELRDAEWFKQPEGAGDMPPRFVATTPAQLAWSYVRRSQQDLLPPRYRQDPIHHRGAPRVPVSWLRDSQLAVLKELSGGPATLAELAQRTGVAALPLERDLACLYYAAAITTTPDKAKRSRGEGTDPGLPAPREQGAPRATRASDLTVAAVLQPAHRKLRA